MRVVDLNKKNGDHVQVMFKLSQQIHVNHIYRTTVTVAYVDVVCSKLFD